MSRIELREGHGVIFNLPTAPDFKTKDLRMGTIVKLWAQSVTVVLPAFNDGDPYISVPVPTGENIALTFLNIAHKNLINGVSPAQYAPLQEEDLQRLNTALAKFSQRFGPV